MVEAGIEVDSSRFIWKVKSVEIGGQIWLSIEGVLRMISSVLSYVDGW